MLHITTSGRSQSPLQSLLWALVSSSSQYQENFTSIEQEAPVVSRPLSRKPFLHTSQLTHIILRNGLSHNYHLGEFTFTFKRISCDFKFLFTFSIIFSPNKQIAPDGMPHFAASHLGLYCLHMCHKKDARAENYNAPLNLRKTLVKVINFDSI